MPQGNEWKKLHPDKVREYNQKAYAKLPQGSKAHPTPSRLANDFKRYKKRLLFRCNKSDIMIPYATTRKYSLHPEEVKDYDLKQSFVNQIEQNYGTNKAEKVAKILNKP